MDLKIHRSAVLLLLVSLGACRSSAGPRAGAAMPFLGTWERSFEADKKSHTATYVVEPRSIRYKLVGDVGNADYVIHRDAYSPDEKRFVGHTDKGEYYVVFVRAATDDSITLYKQKVDSLVDGLGLSAPPASTTKHHGWNTYQRRR